MLQNTLPSKALNTSSDSGSPHARRSRLLATTIAAALCSSLLSGCAIIELLGSSDLETGPKAVDRYSKQGDSVRVVDRNYTASIPQLGAAKGIKEDNPGSYTVVQGDTLWDISGRFLEEPWLWREVWKANPAIKNPHLIYPGDQISLRYDENGVPTLVVSRDGEEIADAMVFGENGQGAVEKLSPRIREQSLKEAIPTIPGDAIRQFLKYPRVVSKKELEKAPYVIGNYEGRLTSAVGHEIYARGSVSRDRPSYGVFRPTKTLRDPGTNEVLGHEVEHVANARLLQPGDPSTLLITSNKMETISGDKLMVANQGFTPHHYIPRTPELQGGEGRVVSLVDAISQSGRNQVVVINLGDRAGIKIGDVLAVERRGGKMIDKYGDQRPSRVSIPNTRTGVVMVFQTYDQVSYALVMESTRPIQWNDVVTDI